MIPISLKPATWYLQNDEDKNKNTRETRWIEAKHWIIQINKIYNIGIINIKILKMENKMLVETILRKKSHSFCIFKHNWRSKSFIYDHSFNNKSNMNRKDVT